MSAPAKPRRVDRIEALARRAEELMLALPNDHPATPLSVIVTEMAREMYRLAHALDEVV